MLKKEINKPILLIIFLFLGGCGYKIIDQDDDIFKGYQSKQYHRYKNIHIACGDSIKKWIEDSLRIGLGNKSEWMVDSVIIFNSDSNKLFTTVNISKRYKKDTYCDVVNCIGGVKIRQQWFFYIMNETNIIPRFIFQDSAYEPLDFNELSIASHFLVLNRSVNRVADSIAIPNEQYFNSYPSDSIIKAAVSEKYSYKLTAEEIQEVSENSKNTRRPIEPRKNIWGKIISKDLDEPSYPGEKRIELTIWDYL